MKYVKPEMEMKKVITNEIASAGIADWLADTNYAGAEGSITNYVMNS